MDYINENPPHLLGCLSKKIDHKRMLKLKEEIENNGWLPTAQVLITSKNKLERINFFANRGKRKICR